MIDVTEEVVSVPAQNRRAAVGASAGRVARRSEAASKKSLNLERVFSDSQIKPFDQVEWERRTAEITDDSGKTIFKQENVEVPKAWSMLATKVVVSKYFYGEQGTPERETSVRQLIHRIC